MESSCCLREKLKLLNAVGIHTAQWAAVPVQLLKVPDFVPMHTAGNPGYRVIGTAGRGYDDFVLRRPLKRCLKLSKHYNEKVF